MCEPPERRIGTTSHCCSLHELIFRTESLPRNCSAGFRLQIRSFHDSHCHSPYSGVHKSRKLSMTQNMGFSSLFSRKRFFGSTASRAIPLLTFTNVNTNGVFIMFLAGVCGLGKDFRSKWFTCGSTIDLIQSRCTTQGGAKPREGRAKPLPKNKSEKEGPNLSKKTNPRRKGQTQRSEKEGPNPEKEGPTCRERQKKKTRN